jgi:hypothetical protein
MEMKTIFNMNDRLPLTLILSRREGFHDLRRSVMRSAGLGRDGRAAPSASPSGASGDARNVVGCVLKSLVPPSLTLTGGDIAARCPYQRLVHGKRDLTLLIQII